MGTLDDPFKPLPTGMLDDAFASPGKRDARATADALPPGGVAAVGRMHGFDLLDRPLVSNLAQCPGQVLVARSTVQIVRSMAGADVVVLFEGGDPQRPIIVGVIGRQAVADAAPSTPAASVVLEVDGDRFVVDAEREIVLRCGDASITLTRAGKVIIKGNYILSRSTGYNKIKGAAVDIN